MVATGARHGGVRRAGAATLVALALGGCASFSETVQPALTALDQRQPEQALAFLNGRLGVETREQVPQEIVGDNAVLLLDRGMVLQAVGDWETASRDIAVADEAIQVLDFTRDSLDDVGRYLFSDSAGQYRSPAYEKLLVPTMQLVGYLGRGDLQGALVEARRLTVMQDFVDRNEGLGQALLGAGSYLAGFAHEKADRVDAALRYYHDALEARPFATLGGPVARLLPRTGFRTPRLEEAAAAAGDVAPIGEGEGELLVIALTGRVPPKVAKRVPVGLALTLAATWIGPARADRARRLAAQGLVTWVNYPELGAPVGHQDVPAVGLDGAAAAVDVYPVYDLVVAEWEQERGAVVASAITRLLTRVAAGLVAREAGGRNRAAGALLSLGTQAALTAADVPDTRSWAMLPANVSLARRVVPAGTHTVTLDARGTRRVVEVDVAPGGWNAVVALELR